MASVNTRPGQVARAQRAFAAKAARDPFGHRKVVAELRAGNPYAHVLLARHGCRYDEQLGAIVSAER